MGDSKLIHDSEDDLFPEKEKDICPVKKSSSFDRNKLMRTPEAEPREFVYVYNYRENRTRRMKKRELLEKLGTLTGSLISYSWIHRAEKYVFVFSRSCSRTLLTFEQEIRNMIKQRFHIR